MTYEVGAPGGRAEPLGGVRALVALGSLAACAASFVTVESLPIGLLPQIAGAMHTSLSAAGLLVTTYALIVVAVTVPLSKATARMSRRALLGEAAAVMSAGCLGCALAPTSAALLAARVLTAAAQAVFWAVGPVQATPLVRRELHGRAVTAVFGGSALGLVLGVPLGTWLGHTDGWRTAFAAMVAVGLVLAGAVLLALPHRSPAEPQGAHGSASQTVRYRMVLLATCLAVTAFFTAFTYANPFLVRVGGVSRGSVALVLLGSGLASTVGLGSGGALYARHPRAWYSTAYNVGIASGPLLGGLALERWGLRAAPLTGAA